MLLLFSVVMAIAFNLVSPAKLVKGSSENRVGADNRSGGQPARSPYFQKSLLERRPAVIQQPAEASLENIVEVSNLTTNEEDVLSQIRNWARKDPESALVWGQQQPDGAERSEALTDVCFQIAQIDPARAVALAEQFNLSNDAVLKNLAQQWAAKDLTTAYNWITRQPEDDRRVALITGMAFMWSQKEPMGAAQFVMQQIPSGAAQDEAVMMVLHQWALVDLTGASTWAQQFPEGQLQNRALNELAGIAAYEQSLGQSKL